MIADLLFAILAVELIGPGLQVLARSDEQRIGQA
jgi:hypothetical protein